ncbi:MAG: 1-acyl-sn-glycerol-3-phosphate acyltransferase, partial [Gemmatimonadota bacterium]|nr:1-acyl-sn-glycerol-3-phosphate acyltransferase [Gemmatimonadota bacterium]
RTNLRAVRNFAYFAVSVVAAALILIIARRRASRWAVRTLHRRGIRVSRFKLARRAQIRESLLAEPEIQLAAKSYAAEHGISESGATRRVHSYIDEIVPFFNILAYHSVGYAVSRALLNFFYRVSAEYVSPAAAAELPRDSIVIYLMNHRSNADYVLVGYVLSGRVAISYAVGEWARAFPLEYIFKSFGSYFIRRRYREPLYHAVLEKYVQLVTRNGVTQGIFPEGGLSRDGRLAPGKIGLLDYMLGVARDPDFRRRMYVVPVAINYDRVIEDRSLLRERDAREGRGRVPKLVQLREVARYASWNFARIIGGRWNRYGRAAVAIGEPVSVARWLSNEEASGRDVLELPRAERLPHVQRLCDSMMAEIGAIIPVTSVTLACAAIQSFDSDFIRRDALIARMEEMREVLLEMNARVLRAERSIEDVFERAWKMLAMRRVLSESETGYAVLPRGRPLVSYYANSVAHLLGPFESGVRERDALPAENALHSRTASPIP